MMMLSHRRRGKEREGCGQYQNIYLIVRQRRYKLFDRMPQNTGDSGVGERGGKIERGGRGERRRERGSIPMGNS